MRARRNQATALFTHLLARMLHVDSRTPFALFSSISFALLLHTRPGPRSSPGELLARASTVMQTADSLSSLIDQRREFQVSAAEPHDRGRIEELFVMALTFALFCCPSSSLCVPVLPLHFLPFIPSTVHTTVPFLSIASRTETSRKRRNTSPHCRTGRRRSRKKVGPPAQVGPRGGAASRLCSLPVARAF
jgi:hypothetical protein